MTKIIFGLNKTMVLDKMIINIDNKCVLDFARRQKQHDKTITNKLIKYKMQKIHIKFEQHIFKNGV